ncbi:beta-N-acetylhexosaminidase [Novosphingobium sp. FKTRR1]|uniref:beta-N-acetylhexosaminidase n=1 Tax=Novosphingobium sp. FKTRR1 TaxID=2879118 RepID=UPI001CF03119|nr:beta-N-acetylhexosaminidase [Novosphingobium sp. FKTRR1]
MPAKRWPALAAVALIAAPVRAEVPVIPLPQTAEADAGVPGGIALGSGTPIMVQADDTDAAGVADWLGDIAHQRLGLHFPRKVQQVQGLAIRFVHKPVDSTDAKPLGGEGYRLDIDARGATITAPARAGLFYGAVTLAQLLAATPGQPLAAVHITDAPHYAWRGLMLDSARHMQSVPAIERLIDLMALHKFNRLQWHLTDDQGWRLQIPAFPRLTSVGAWRVGPDGKRYGGFYTQAQVRHVVAYAAARGITIVPEIEMPGHALAALRAYPEWGFAGVPASAQADWGVFPSIFGVEPVTLKALQTVLDEVMALFPGREIATGGDEALHDQWRASPAVQARIKALGLRDETALQGWFAGQMARYLAAHGRQAIGWDDLLAAGGIPEGAVVLSWHSPQGATTALKAGHDVVLATDPVFYFDHRQAPGRDEPPGRGTVITPADIYAVDPGSVDAATSGHLLGVQGQIWTEYVRSDAQMLAMAWPRAAALAELGWTTPARRDWTGFSARLPAEAQLLARWQVQPTPGAFGVTTAAVAGEVPSQAMQTCSNRIALNLPTAGEHPALVDIMDRCWVTPPVALDAPTITVRIATLPFNYQLAADAKTITLRPPVGNGDELVVRQDTCDGPELARVPLDAVPHDAVPTAVSVPLGAATGTHKLCLFAASRSPAPLWAIETVTLP